MKTEDKNNVPKVRLAVIGKKDVGKSGEYFLSWISHFLSMNRTKNSFLNNLYE